MVNIILISHGDMCLGMLDGLKMIGGGDYGVKALPLLPGTTPETYRENLAKLIEESRDKSNDGTLILSDISGGTPYLSAAYLSKNYKLALISGMNMPMLLTLALDRNDESTLDSLLEKAESTYKRAYKATMFRKGEMKNREKLSLNKNR